MNVALAWQKGYTGKGVVVSILDDGIQTNHPDLSQNYVSKSFDFLIFSEPCRSTCFYRVTRTAVTLTKTMNAMRMSQQLDLKKF